MFEDTLLIIKADYMHKRKAVLLKLLTRGFQIKGHRRVLFSPENAAEFYKELAEDTNFMLNVILLSKGNAEAFILSKEDAVSDLINTLVCYFTTSIEMERNVHVSKCRSSVDHEISFIFPNYIYEPVSCFENMRFCKNPMMSPLVDELYDIMQNCKVKQSYENWKEMLADWLMASNKTEPIISNQCSITASVGFEDKAQQASLDSRKDLCDSHRSSLESPGSRSSTYSSDGSSVMMSSSSCITCSTFERSDIRDAAVEKVDSLSEMVKAKLRQTGTITLIEEEHEGEEVAEEEGMVAKWYETGKITSIEEEQAEQEHECEEVVEEEGVVADWYEVTDADEIFIASSVPEQLMGETLKVAEPAEKLVEPEPVEALVVPESVELLVEPELAKELVVSEPENKVMEPEPQKEVVESEPEKEAAEPEVAKTVVEPEKSPPTAFILEESTPPLISEELPADSTQPPLETETVAGAPAIEATTEASSPEVEAPAETTDNSAAPPE